MITILVILHALICLFLVIAVMLQQGKGASMGMLGGASQSWFGPTGSKTFLMKFTVILSIAFLLTSILISLVASQRSRIAPTQAPASPPTEQR